MEAKKDSSKLFSTEIFYLPVSLTEAVHIQFYSLHTLYLPC